MYLNYTDTNFIVIDSKIKSLTYDTRSKNLKAKQTFGWPSSHIYKYTIGILKKKV